MKPLLLIVVSSITFSLFGQSPSLADLKLFSGQWNVSEVFMEGTPYESRESGVRTCSYILDSAYIQCETISTNTSGKKRIYHFYINYNSFSHQFEMISLYNDWPLKRRDVIRMTEDGLNFHILGEPTLENGQERRIWGDIKLTGDSYIWTGRRNTSQDKPDEWKVIFVEKGERIL